jgi:hypothetical protein
MATVRKAAPAAANKAVKTIKVAADSAKYTGYEYEWAGVDVTEKSRPVLKLNAFNWYNYHLGAKEALEFINEYLKVFKRTDELAAFKKVGERAVPQAIGWLARMHLMGWPIDAEEQKRVNDAIADAIAATRKVKPVAVDTAPVGKKPNIQDRMREKSAEAGGEIEGLLDQYIAAGAKPKHNLSPIGVLKLANILPAHVGAEVVYWEGVRDEIKEAHAGNDPDLVEGYGHFNKIQLRNIAKFIDTIIADYHGYTAFKKVTKAPRKVKVKTPAQLTVKLKYMAESKEPALKSEKPTKIVGAKEMYVYDAKKRKLQYYIADEYAGTLSVKGTTVVGFDVVKSLQKTVRKPAEQLKALMAAARPATRKLFEQTKSVETKVTGRFNEHMLILKVW